MVTLGDIENLSRRIAEKFDVEKIILFGSYADGTATEQSDIDRLIRLVRDWVPGLAKLLPFAQKLTIHGVDTRYPDEVRVVDDIEMKQVVEIAEKFREVILKKI